MHIAGSLARFPMLQLVQNSTENTTFGPRFGPFWWPNHSMTIPTSIKWIH